jgi:hypothetical protein
MWGGIWLGPGRGGAAIGAAEGRPGGSGVRNDMFESDIPLPDGLTVLMEVWPGLLTDRCSSHGLWAGRASLIVFISQVRAYVIGRSAH